jgi:GrpB-like predicted nucleotidyltransferase (UPF0157 family)
VTLVRHQGGCHCGRVRFEVDAPADIEAAECNCSMCSKLGFLHLIVPRTRFRLLSGDDALTSYTFNTGVAKHLFCATCGVKSFYVPRSHPDGYSVNVRCLDPGTVASVEVQPFDGRNWEAHVGELAPLPAESVERPIELYESALAVFLAYDPATVEVARRVRDLVRARDARLEVEHIGSTAVPGCAGKGIVDLALVYRPGDLEAAKGALAALGFQPQSTRDPFPESRPMRVGVLRHDGRQYRLHVHVLANDGPEIGELRDFRDRLRADAGLRAAYEARKRAILASGVTDSVDYSYAKGEFITGALARASGSERVS